MSMCSSIAADGFRSTPDALAGGPPTPRGQVCECCTNILRLDRRFVLEGKLEQLLSRESTGRESRPDGTNGRDRVEWKADVSIDGSRPKVTVKSRLRAINKTGDTRSYPGTVAMTDEELGRLLPPIAAHIERTWNKPYVLRVIDDKCGEQRFPINFDVEFTSTSPHYDVHFVNVDGFGTLPDPRGVMSGRSYVAQADYFSKWNLRGPNGWLGSRGTKRTEAHEYGHMLGLIDEYEELRDLNNDGDGLDGRINGRWEVDRGGMRYTFPNRPPEIARPNGELMSNMRQARARPARYGITVLYAAKEILERSGRTVSFIDVV
ncbi:MAG: hypothetical protein AAGA56_24665 [Myxococcota bacterium]